MANRPGTQLLERADHAVGTANVLYLRVARAFEERERLLECKAAGGAGHERGFGSTWVHKWCSFTPRSPYAATCAATTRSTGGINANPNSPPFAFVAA